MTAGPPVLEKPPERHVVLVPVERRGLRRALLAVGVFLSLLIHGGVAYWVAHAPPAETPDRVVRVRVVEPKPPPKEEPPPPPPPPKEQPPVDLSKPTPPVLATNTAPAPPDAPPPRPLFGVSMQSTVASGQGAFQVAVGNTVAKEPEKERVAPSEVGALPAVDYRRVETEPVVIEKFEAEYPAEEREQGVEGTTVLRLTIDDQGRVTEARVVRGPSQALDNAARQAMFRHRFKPATVDGRPRAVTGFIYSYVWIIDR